MTRRKKQESLATALITVFVFIIQSIIILIVRLIIFIYDIVTFYTSKYKRKSGNNFFKTYFNKGNYGEFVLYRKIIRIVDNEYVLTNLYLDNHSKNTDTTEIDVLAISSKGIYVFEMKNYSGYIYGSEQDQHWTQVLNRWTKNKFYNPLRQNYSHIKAVESYLGVPNSTIIPMIVFSNRSKLSKITISDSQHVFQYRDALKFIKKHEKTKEERFSFQQMEGYLVQLLEKCNMSEEVKQKHMEEVKELKKQKESFS
jgi:hypothetical protein